jgi:hypothetical protein
VVRCPHLRTDTGKTFIKGIVLDLQILITTLDSIVNTILIGGGHGLTMHYFKESAHAFECHN